MQYEATESSSFTLIKRDFERSRHRSVARWNQRMLKQHGRKRLLKDCGWVAIIVVDVIYTIHWLSMSTW